LSEKPEVFFKDSKGCFVGNPLVRKLHHNLLTKQTPSLNQVDTTHKLHGALNPTGL